MPDRSRAMTQTNRDTLALQVGGLAWGLTMPHRKKKKIVVTKAKQKYCSTGQSPQRAVAPTEEEITNKIRTCSRIYYSDIS
jgi:hypothetical protein